MKRLALLLLAPLALMTPSLVAPAQAAPSPASYAAKAHQATNDHRATHGLKALKQNTCLQKLAVKQATRMAAASGLSHQPLGPVMSRCGLRAAGENVADGFPTGAKTVNAGWMKSAPHRANILTGRYRIEGIGAVQSRDGTWFVSQVFGTKR
jgi:uncharacterized protein YkwD